MAKDLIHDAVKLALVNDGWTVTDDPLIVHIDKNERHYEIDLGAEKMITAEKNNQKIAVEVKSFARRSLLNEFHGVLGQYLAYLAALDEAKMQRILYIGISENAYDRLQSVNFLMNLISTYKINLLIVDVNQQKSKQMDKIAKYKQIIKKEFESYATIPVSNRPNVERQLIINKDLTQFVLFNIGWNYPHYIHSLIFHVEVRKDRIWVHEDHTDYDIAWQLIKRGIPQSDIVLGYVPDYAKAIEGFAPA